MLPNYDPLMQALIASLFTWGVTALGAALVFILPSNSRTFLDGSLGFAGGVMTAASFWSLLAPAIEISEAKMGAWAFVPVAIGFALGAAFVCFSDKMIPSCVGAELSIIEAISCNRTGEAVNETEVVSLTKEQLKADITGTKSEKKKVSLSTGEEAIAEVPTLQNASQQNLPEVQIQSAKITINSTSVNTSPSNSSELMLSWRRILLLIMAVTVHNFPEGLAVGVGFGSVGKTPAATFEKAFNLALGIGLQNFPEGLAVSLPLAGFGYSRFRAFLYGQLSGMVEPVAALLGASAVILMESVLPYALSFAAGAMIYVVFDSIIPEAYSHGNGKLASASAIIGFLVMMSLDVGLG